MPVRLFATDLDGTLLRTDGTISARTRDAVDAAEAAGIGLVIATGRPPRWIPPIIEQLGERGLVVCGNGALVYDPARHELVDRHEIAPDVAAEIVRRLRSAHPDAGLALEQGFSFHIDPEYPTYWDPPPDVVRAPVEEFLDEPVTKLLFRHPEPAPVGLAAAVQALVAGLAEVTHSGLLGEAFLELSATGVHKAATVERVIAESGIAAADVVAFGDMPNDLELLRWAGHGVAVANAHPAVLAAADEVTASNDEDGVALVIERELGT
ncbi:MAG: Cof-type family hydrolase [Acidimicrobiales bacterium]|nr:Cof-type family hydrolase [Acidimicrobiales bacterium]